MLKLNLTQPLQCHALGVLAVLADESAVDFGAALVGGAVRNAAHDVEMSAITDHDIAIYGDFDDALGDIEKAMFNAGYNEVARFSDEGEYADGQVWLVLKYDHPEFPNVDLLFHPQAKTIVDVMNTFDFNINQFCATAHSLEQGMAFYHGLSVHEAIELDGGQLPFNHPSFAKPVPGPQKVLTRNVGCDVERTAKMVKIADLLGWAVPPSIRPIIVNERMPGALPGWAEPSPCPWS